jgi:AcrR family transcriptional regulator
VARPPLDRRERKRERTASHLSATAFSLFEAQGYDAVSMEQIAAEADVAKATLYSYFPVKEALIAHRFREDLATGMVERAVALAAHDRFDARMRYLLRESAAWHSARRTYLPHYMRFLTSQAAYGRQAPGGRSHDNVSLQILTVMFQTAQKDGEVATTQAAGEIAWSFQYLLLGAVTAWLKDPAMNLTDRFLAAFDLVMHGVAMPPAPGKTSQLAAASRKTT